MKTLGFCLRNYSTLLLFSLFVLSACDNDDPAEESIPETITEVTLSFITDNGSTVVSVTATDPDGEGPRNIEIDAPINLNVAKEYKLQIMLANGLSSPPIDISKEVADEGTDHMFFFGWTGDIFSDPSGNGNIDNRQDVVNYAGENSMDEKGLPLGLSTQWTTSPAPASGELRIVLKHLPGLKTTTSASTIGETDIDVTFDVLVH
jgi:hypothetical protein